MKLLGKRVYSLQIFIGIVKCFPQNYTGCVKFDSHTILAYVNAYFPKMLTDIFSNNLTFVHLKGKKCIFLVLTQISFFLFNIEKKILLLVPTSFTLHLYEPGQPQPQRGPANQLYVLSYSSSSSYNLIQNIHT